MAMSAARIRSIYNRNRVAVEKAFPGLRRPTTEFPYNLKSGIPTRFRGDAMQNALARAGLV